MVLEKEIVFATFCKFVSFSKFNELFECEASLTITSVISMSVVTQGYLQLRTCVSENTEADQSMRINRAKKGEGPKSESA